MEPDNSRPLFPQRLTSFEYYFYVDERPEYPAFFPIQLQWQGHLNRSALEQAYRMAHGRHPLISARVVPPKFGRPSWQAGQPAPVTWSEDDACAKHERLHDSAGGLRLFVDEQPDRVLMNFVFHHAAVDGLAAFQFVKDFLLAYDHLAFHRPGQPHWSRLEAEQLAKRHRMPLIRGREALRDLLKMTTISTRLLLERAAVLTAHRQQPLDIVEGAVPRFIVEHLSAEETAELSAVARERSVMLNDLLVRDMFLTLARWNEGSAEAKRPIRLLLPTNLRGKELLRMPAANMFGYAFLSRSGHALHDRGQLLQSLQDEIVAIKRERRARYFEAGLRLFCLCPPMLRWSTRRPWPFATAVFSNLGTSFDHLPFTNHKCGELTFREGAGAPTIRPDTRAAFAVHTYAGRMAVCLRCDPLWFDDDEQHAMLGVYLQALRATIELRT